MDSDALAEAAYFLQVTQFIFACGYALTIYDWLISLLRERNLIWGLRFGLVKVLYMFCRYWPIAVVPYILVAYLRGHSWEYCQRVYQIPVALAMWNQLGAEAVLLARTCAFLGNRAIISLSLLFLLSGLVAYQLYVVFGPMKLLPFVIPPFDKGPCLPTDQGLHILGFFLAPLLFDTLVTVLMIRRVVQMRRSLGGAGESPLLRLFVAEGLWYFILVSLGNLLNGIFYFQPKKVMSAINIPFSIMLPNIIACRLILDLREISIKDQRWKDSATPTGLAGFLLPSAWVNTVRPPAEVSTIQFEAAPRNGSTFFAIAESIEHGSSVPCSKLGRSTVDIIPGDDGRTIEVELVEGELEAIKFRKPLEKLV